MFNIRHLFRHRTFKNKWTEGAALFKQLCKLYVVAGGKKQSDKGKDIYTDITAYLRRLAGLDNNMHARSELTHNIYRDCELWLDKRGSVNDAERPVQSWVCWGINLTLTYVF